MFAKLARSSISWSVYAVITTMLAACVLTLFVYSAFALNCIGEDCYEDCQDGDFCDGVPDNCLTDWQIDGDITCVHYDSDVNDCGATVYSDHSVWYRNTCNNGIAVDWMYKNWLGASNQDGADQCIPPGSQGDGPGHAKVLGSATVPGNSSFTNTYTGLSSTWSLIPSCNDYQAFFYTLHKGPGHADASCGEVVETNCP